MNCCTSQYNFLVQFIVCCYQCSSWYCFDINSCNISFTHFCMYTKDKQTASEFSTFSWGACFQEASKLVYTMCLVQQFLWLYYIKCDSYARGSHLYVTCWSNLRPWSKCLIGKYCAWLLDRLIFQGQRSNCSHAFLIHWFSNPEAILIPWSAPKKGFDHLIQFWSRSQTLLHGTY